MPEPDHPTDAGPLGRAALAECPHCGTRVLPLPGRLCPACRRDLDVAPGRRAVVESDEVLAAGRKMARRLLRSQLSADEVMRNLVDRGIQPDSVVRVVREACADQVEWLETRGWKAIWLGCRAALFASFCGLASFLAWQNRQALLVPTIIVGAVSVGLIAHGRNLCRRAAGYADLIAPAMKSGPGPVDTRGDYPD